MGQILSDERGGPGRTAVGAHLHTLSWTADAPETLDAVLLSVSELITTAHVHAHSAASVLLSWDGVCLHVNVSDYSTHLPTQRTGDTTSSGGRGPAIVEAVSEGWQAHPRPVGKTVTACFSPPGQADPHRSA